MPLRKFQQRRYLDYSRDVAWIQFNPDRWKQLTTDDLDHIACSVSEASISITSGWLTC
jgi:hypothetical protein